MIKAREWPMRAIYILIAAALALSLFITAAPAHNVSAAPNNVKAEWERVSTPTMEDWVLAPDSVIFDYALADGGDVAYAIIIGYNTKQDSYGNWLLKSTDGAATWKDLNDALDDVLDENEHIDRVIQVATDWVDPDFVAVALSVNSTPGNVTVFFSTDGGTTFNDAGEVEDGGFYLNVVADLEVSIEAAGKRDMVIAGTNSTVAQLFRSTVTGDNAGGWEDATDYAGWDNVADGITGNDLSSMLVTDIIFSPNWASDKTILVTTVNGTGPYSVYLQSGSFGTTAGWNAKSTLGIAAVLILGGAFGIPTQFIGIDARGIAGITVPSDYNSKSTETRVLWVWVNYYNAGPTAACQIMRVDNDTADPVVQQIKDGKVWLTNVSYMGTTAEGQALAALLGTGGYARSLTELLTGCCVGVQVYRNTGIHNMDICCERWQKACKLPTGTAAMAVSYVSEDKAYAVALWGVPDIDEGAWSVTFDGGDTWNQLSLVDTDIDYLSDVAVSPDCNKIMLVSVNIQEQPNGSSEYCGCDSVWLKATNLPEAQEYSGKWLRTWCGSLEGNNSIDFPGFPERGLLRLPADETTGDTVFLIDRMTGTVLVNDLETLGCWTSISSTTVDSIADLVAIDAETLYALDYNGDVSLYDSEGWNEAVESEVDEGWTIAVHGEDVLVGGDDGEVSYSDDGGETFALLEEVSSIGGLVSVAFDSYYDTNNIVYAATALAKDNGIYRWVIDESDSWEDMGAADYDYTGIVLGRNPGNPKTSADTGGVLYASYFDGYRCDYSTCWSGEKCWYTGVARSLNPAKTIECQQCVEWDYLTVGLTENEDFVMGPQALKICGCMDPTTNTKLFAIGDVEGGYDMEDGEEGTVWTFEDCYAKKAPNVTLPTGNTTIPADPCSCYNAPFTVKWDGLCDACRYEVQFALDEDFTTVFDTIPAPPEGSTTPTSILIEGGEEGALLSCEMTYYLRVRATEAGTCQEIHSWWSEPLKLVIAPQVASAIVNLVSPAPGATGVAVKNVGFSWNLIASANKFDWVLSKNADLSTPVDSKTGLTTKAASYSGTLAYDTTYYWQVTAWNDGAKVGTSAIGTFITAPSGPYCSAIDGMCFATQAELAAHNAELTKPAPTPFWVWVVIAIGAVLVIVVIVLIFRTRRV